MQALKRKASHTQTAHRMRARVAWKTGLGTIATDHHALRDRSIQPFATLASNGFAIERPQAHNNAGSGWAD